MPSRLPLLLILLATPLAPATSPESPPFIAWVNENEVNVRDLPDPRSTVVGGLSLGDQVTVSGCLPDCVGPGAWALLQPYGAVRASLLSRSPTSEMALAQSATARFIYASVRNQGSNLLVEPDSHALVATRFPAGHMLAFRDDPELLARGWLRRPGGGYMRAADVRIAKPSAFSGELAPTLPLVFIVQATRRAGQRDIARYERGALLDLDARELKTTLGVVPRAAARIAWASRRPAVVPIDAAWVHVDLGEQTMIVYLGDEPILATLVSTGKPDRATATGLFSVHYKVVHARMRGTAVDPYFVDEVPDAQYFYDGMALHGAFWHDAFGTPVSHGCVNLSVADAAWLFEWAPPAVPPGWHSVVAGPGQRTLWVQIEERALPTDLSQFADEHSGG